MTRQKFYEECVLRTMRRAVVEDEGPFVADVRKLGDIINLGFNELMMKWNLAGLTPIPEKEDFKSWGVPYLAQLLKFVETEGDLEFTNEFFSFLKKNKSLYKTDKDHMDLGDICYYAFVDNINGDRDFCNALSSFIMDTFEGSEWFGKFLSLAEGFAFVEYDHTDRFFELRRKYRDKAKTA